MASFQDLLNAKTIGQQKFESGRKMQGYQVIHKKVDI